jgi:hypothetical protein
MLAPFNLLLCMPPPHTVSMLHIARATCHPPLLPTAFERTVSLALCLMHAFRALPTPVVLCVGFGRADIVGTASRPPGGPPWSVALSLPSPAVDQEGFPGKVCVPSTIQSPWRGCLWPPHGARTLVFAPPQPCCISRRWICFTMLQAGCLVPGVAHQGTLCVYL